MSRMKKSAFALSALTLAMLAPAVQADLAFNVGAVSDYRFRGVSQSAQDPALQGGVDFTDKSGFYLGAWASTIDFGAFDSKADFEVDLYGGYKWKAANVDWDVGVIHYAYPGSTSALDLPFTEFYVGGTYGVFSAKYFLSSDFFGGTGDAYYFTVGANLDIGNGFTLGLSAGKSGGDAFAGGLAYTDYKVGVSKDYAGFTFNASYIDTSGTPEITSDVFNNEGTVVLSVLKAF